MLLTSPTIGKQIAHYRKERKLTQKELACVALLPYRYLSDIETGRRFPRIHTLARLAAGLGISIDELVGRR